MRIFLLGLLVLIAIARPALACGTGGKCVLPDGRYYYALVPDQSERDRPFGALIYAHGLGGTGRGPMRSRRFAGLAAHFDLALISLKSVGAAWAMAGSPWQDPTKRIDEIAYIRAVLSDAAQRFGIDPARRVMTGFSAGGQLTWVTACKMSREFAAFIPMAGTFWQPIPSTCRAPARSLVHIHGRYDRVVPVAGKPKGPFMRGNVHDVLAMYSKHGQFGNAQRRIAGELDCAKRRNQNGDLLTLCLFEGGHRLRVEHIGLALSFLREAGRL